MADATYRELRPSLKIANICFPDLATAFIIWIFCFRPDLILHSAPIDFRSCYQIQPKLPALKNIVPII